VIPVISALRGGTGGNLSALRDRTRGPASVLDVTTDCDVAVVGAGIVGLAVARELALRRPRLRIVVLEREPAVGLHQTSHNSGVIHAGIYYAPGSLKARLCVEGARDLYAFCEERGVPHERRGKVIVARDPGELGRLDELERRGRANGVPGLRRLAPAELGELEPHCRGVAALHSPATGVVDFAAVARALASELGERGVEVRTGVAVEGVRAEAHGLALSHGEGEARARFAVLAAGAWADRLAVAAGADPDPRIVPFRGAYLRVRRERAGLVRSLIYPVPDPALPFLGVHLSRHLDGSVTVGPTALIAGSRTAYRLRTVRPRDLADTLAWPGTWRLVRRFWRTGVTELRHTLSPRSLARAAATYVPELEPGDLEPGFAGVRAQALGRDGRLIDDFEVSRTERALHVRNAPSPAATSALALARLIADEAERGLD
jgi:(S)-2-hydroxyglutarate dehydrogenase